MTTTVMHTENDIDLLRSAGMRSLGSKGGTGDIEMRRERCAGTGDGGVIMMAGAMSIVAEIDGRRCRVGKS